MAPRAILAATGEPARQATAQAPTVAARTSPPSAQYRLAAACTVPSAAATVSQVNEGPGTSSTLGAPVEAATWG
jgi:hypothetical protein